MGFLEFITLLFAKGLATVAMGMLLCVGFTLGHELMAWLKTKFGKAVPATV